MVVVYTNWFTHRTIVVQHVVQRSLHALPPPTHSEQPEKHIAALDLRGKPQDFELYLEKSGRNYVRRKYWADFEHDDMDYLRQYDEEYTDEKLLIEETNWLEGSDTLQSMVEEGFEELMDADNLDFESAF